ncbi:MAG: uracil-DNA glycosylase family protein [Haloferacaceae archaeon]
MAGGDPDRGGDPAPSTQPGGEGLEPPERSDRNVLEPDCVRCPDLVASRNRISWGNGPRDADVVVVGEAPGAGDPGADEWRGGNHSGLAYTARHSGRRIRETMVAVGYGDRTYYTNAVKCFPADDSGERNREPTDRELSNCRGHLLTELERVDPSAVVATGKHATASLLAVEERTVERFVDSVLDPRDCPTLGAPVLPLLHPSYRDVWLARLGYDLDGYRAALRERLDALVG